jgi:tRNA threonylcarbamoyladenosine biosynthesis protein TsaE
MDVYRLDGKVDEIGLEDYFKKGGIVIIEWADLIKDYLPEERLDIKFRILDEESRSLTFVPHGRQYEEICEAVL